MDEKDTSFRDCQHMHMMKNGAPPDKIGVLHRLFTYRIPWFHIKNYFLMVFTLWFTVLSQFFREGMGPFDLQCPMSDSSKMFAILQYDQRF